MRTKYSIICFLLSLFSISCKQTAFEKEMRVFNNSRIELMLDSMNCVRTKDEMVVPNKSEYTYVIYVDSFSCSDCALNHFKDWVVLETQFDHRKFTYLFIVNPKKGERTHFIEKVKNDTLFNNRIYIDTTDVFKRHNPMLPQNNLLHTFMINKKDTVILIGNPINNRKMKELLNKIVQ